MHCFDTNKFWISEQFPAGVARFFNAIGNCAKPTSPFALLSCKKTCDRRAASSGRCPLFYISCPYFMHFSVVGTEELAHMEMIAAILYQLTKNMTMEEIKKSGFDTYFVDHTAGIYPVSAAGVPFTASYFAVKGDMFTDLHEDLAAEQKARVTYDNILRLVDDPDVRDPIKFLRQREINHFQRFGDTILTLSNRCEKCP